MGRVQCESSRTDHQIIEPHSAELLPISTVGKTSAAYSRYRIRFGIQSKPHTLQIVGRWSKEIELDNYSATAGAPGLNLAWEYFNYRCKPFNRLPVAVSG